MAERTHKRSGEKLPALSSVGMLMGRAYYRFRTHLEQALAEGDCPDIAMGMGPILFHLHRSGESSLSEMVEAVGIGKATVTQQVRAMEQKGLVERRRHESDGRVVLVRLTVAGEQRIADLARVGERVEVDLRQLLGRDYPAAQRVLARLAGMTSERPPAEG